MLKSVSLVVMGRKNPNTMPTNGVLIAIMPGAGDSDLGKLVSIRTRQEAGVIPLIVAELAAEALNHTVKGMPPVA